MTSFDNIIKNISNIVGRKKSFNYKLKNGLYNIYWGIKVNKNIDFKIIFIFNKIIELISLGNNIIILVADVHTILDNNSKSINNDTDFFINKLNEIIISYNLNDELTNRIKIIKGSDFQLSKEYLLDMFKLISINGSIKDYCNELNMDINSISFNNIIHPIMQTLDEEHIQKSINTSIDCQIGYSHNIKQYVFSKKHMSQLGFNSKIYLLYDIPTHFIEKPFYLNSINYISFIYTFNEKTLIFMFNTIIDTIKIRKHSSLEEISENTNLFLKLPLENKYKIIVKFINLNIKV